MAVSAQSQVPSTPRVISPSPTPSENGSASGYFTRSAARRMNSSRDIVSPPPIDEHDSSSGSDELGRRPRLRSRSPVKKRLKDAAVAQKTSRNKKDLSLPNGTSNGHLSPHTASSNKDYWRSLSRSPSPLGLIPIHQEWRSFIHRHEIPRKILHTSIGFLTLGLYASYAQPSQIHPVLLALFIPIFTTDIIRHRYPAVNRFYIRCLGALMRESEVDGWNGVIWYLLGAWAALRFFPKDIGVMAVMLLSWCDTAASTAGRRWGRYTPQVRRGKSLAGSLAALLAGVATAAAFYGWIAPKVQSQNPTIDTGDFAFAFQGQLGLPAAVKGYLGMGDEQGSIGGTLALGVMSFVAGVVASASEAIDLFGWDDNVTIPVLCGGGLWAFLKTFGSA
ncbi:Diacylglycerol kinase [Botryosphaeria dothidea]